MGAPCCLELTCGCNPCRSCLVRETGDARRRQPPGNNRRSLAEAEARSVGLVAIADFAESLRQQRVAVRGDCGDVK